MNSGYQSDTVFITLTRQNRTIEYVIPCKLELTPQYGCVTIDGDDLLFFAYNKVFRLNGNGTFKIKQLSTRILCIHTGDNNNIWIGLLKQGAITLNADLTEIKGSQLNSDLALI